MLETLRAECKKGTCKHIEAGFDTFFKMHSEFYSLGLNLTEANLPGETSTRDSVKEMSVSVWTEAPIEILTVKPRVREKP